MNFDERLAEILNRYNIQPDEVKPLAKDISELIILSMADMEGEGQAISDTVKQAV